MTLNFSAVATKKGELASLRAGEENPLIAFLLRLTDAASDKVSYRASWREEGAGRYRWKATLKVPLTNRLERNRVHAADAR